MTIPRGHRRKRIHRQEAVIAALLQQPTVGDAARAAGVGEKTVRRWLQDETFLRAYRAARRGIVDSALLRLQQCTASAVLALHRNLTSAPPAVQVQAAKIILEHAVRALETGDLLTRLEALERQVAERAHVVDAMPTTNGYALVPAAGPEESSPNGEREARNGSH
jgi:hypothetical protein